MNEKDTNKTEESPDNRESLDITARMSSLPRFQPRAVFRLKIALISRFPDSNALRKTLGMPGAITARGTRRDIPGWQVVFKPATLTLVAASVILFLFVGLTVLAGSSRPGDALYAFKHARESIEMSFTRDPVAKAKKKLSMAEKRLAELESFVSSGTLDEDKIEYIADEYRKNKEYIEDVIASDAAGYDTSRLQAHLCFIEDQKDSIIEGVTSGAGPEGIPLPAVEADVTVQDTSGRNSLGRVAADVTGKTDENGEFEFEYMAGEPDDARDIEVMIELDGRKTLAPLFEAGDNPSPKVVPETVSAVITPLPEGGSAAVLNNGLVRVTTDSQGGVLIEKLDSDGNVVAVAGPLELTLMSEEVFPIDGDALPAKGPYIVSTGVSSAACELRYDIAVEGGTVRKTSRVGLSEGDGHVTVSCAVSGDGNSTGSPPLLLQVSLPLGSNARVGGKSVKSAGNGEPVSADFNKTKPYATFQSGGETVSLVCPDAEPEEWSFSENLLTVDFVGGNINDPLNIEATMLLGFCGDEEAVWQPFPDDFSVSAPAADDDVDGFSIECSPALDKLKAGRHRVTLTIGKRYEKLSDYFE